jgi:hypothetical protein
VTKPYWSDDAVTLHLGDCLEVLAGMEAASADAIVTDPPAAVSFMGREWDSDMGGRAQWVAWLAERMAQAVRVLRPGGHALVWSLPRTAHWTAWALEDAGLQIRDCIPHLFGSGFPKSLDIGKAIDKRAEENAETKRRIAAVAEVIRSHREAMGMTPQQVSLAVVGTPSGACWNWEHHQLPSVEMWPAIKAALGIPGTFDALIEGDRAQFIAAEREVTGLNRNWGAPSLSTPNAPNGEWEITTPATEDAARWDGWGTALKPGQELWWLARKPIRGTVAANVLEHGTGALNIDGCRVAGGLRPARSNEASASGLTGTGGAATYGSFTVRGSVAVGETDAGRWPPNLVLTHSAACDARCAGDCPVGELDRQSGVLTSGANPTRRGSDKFRDAYGEFTGQQDCTPHRGADIGGASRFYPTFRYQAKAPSRERPRGEDGSAHPTVKSLPLMQWLCRLITPPGGTVLDLFAGSGSTAEAAIIEGFRCILIEADPASAELIRIRLRKDIQPAMFA